MLPLVAASRIAATPLELAGQPFQKFAAAREEWAISDLYLNPGSTQFAGASVSRTTTNQPTYQPTNQLA